MEVKYGDDAETKRNLLRRACSLSLKPKVMKNLFTKWLEFEQKHNDKKRVAEVKSLAAKYIENCMAKINDDEDEADAEELEV